MVKGSGFPLIPGKWMISTGIFKNVNAIRAFEDTEIKITALNGDTTTYILPAGTDTSIGFKHTNVIVVSGSASIADNTVA